MKNYLKIFVVAFLLSAAYCLLSNGFSALNLSAQSRTLWILGLMSLGAYLINPILVFVVFYFIGKKINLSSELKVDTVSLAIGSWVGYVVFLIPLMYLTAVSSYTPLLVFSDLFTGVLRALIMLFIGLGGLAIAFIRKAKPDSSLQPKEQQSI